METFYWDPLQCSCWLNYEVHHCPLHNLRSMFGHLLNTVLSIHLRQFQTRN